MFEHPDETIELALGLATVLGGAAMEAGGVALDIPVVGAPAGVALNVSGTGVMAAGAATATAGAGQLAGHAMTDDRVDPQCNELFPKNESEAAPKSEDGPEPAKDPDGQHPDYPDRNNLGQYHRQDTVSKATEHKGLDKIDASDDFDEPVLCTQVEAHVDGVPQVRKYDGLGENPNGT